ncbi:hypothetical protein RYH80_10335 [Halobaculum sp. MBLA0147]|uniref:hypothetical protein n=1 Tax=Halobaculum sp. MBLA0147 TaxID=3079934 RepID=UPI003524F130
MHELDCDFCDAPAVGAYEVGPEPPERSPTDRRRLVLCGECRETLAVAIEPLLDRLDAAEASAGGDAADDGASGGRRVDTGTDAGRPADRADGDRVSRGRGEGQTNERQTDERQTDERQTDEGSRTRDAGQTRDGDGITVDVSADDSTAAGDGADPTATSGGEDDAATDDPLATDTTAEDGAATDGHSVTATDDTDDRSTAEGAPQPGDDETTTEATGDEQVGEEPPQFRRVMRLLNNREFPVDRAEFADLATGAYGLDDGEVDRIVEYAVDRGVLAVDDGRLVKG